MASGLSRAPGPDSQAALMCLAAEVAGNRTLTRDWTGQDLVMMLEGTGQTLAGHAVFEQLTAALEHRARREPLALVRALGCLSRFALSATHLSCARRLLDALRAGSGLPQSPRCRHELLWSTTLFHFASLQASAVDEVQPAFFAQFYRLVLSLPVTGESEEWAGMGSDDQWHQRWASDYWQPALRVDRRAPATRPTPPVSPSQSQLFARLHKAFPGHDLQPQARINDCPVDLLIDGRVCVEVDGALHAVETAAGIGPSADTGLVRAARSQDLFIDHMLHRYGYLVCRIADSRDPARLDAQVGQIRTALASPVLEAQVAGQDKTGAPPILPPGAGERAGTL